MKSKSHSGRVHLPAAGPSPSRSVASAGSGARAGARRALVSAAAALALAACLLLGIASVGPSAPAAAQAAGFPDVSKNIPAYDAIQFMTAAGVISGFKDGTFRPGETLNRGQATKVLVLWRQVKVLSPSSSSFSDPDVVYGSYIETAYAQGWISGFSDGSFRAYSTLSRQQMAIIMVRAMGWDAEAQKLSSSAIAKTLSAFSDGVEVAAVARPYVALAVQRGLFGGGGDGRFAPRDGITRAQFALVVMRAELSLRAVIDQVRFAEYTDKTRVVLDLSQAPGKVTAAISADGHLTIDYQGGAIAGGLSQTIGSQEVEEVDALQQAYDPRTVRVTFDLARYQRFRVASIGPSDGKGYRIVVDVFKRTGGPSDEGPPLICVDPGHGGSATGAVGVSGTPEKTINLAISLLLADELEDAGLGVIMTRTKDVDVGLRERGDIANEAQASLFISVHSNASASPDSCGTETFYEGTDSDYDPESQRLAQAIQRNLIAALGSMDRGAKTWYGNTLAVLDQSTMTGALAEVGFMTNAVEEAKLLDPVYQAKAGEAIAAGILEYLQWSTTVYPTL